MPAGKRISQRLRVRLSLQEAENSIALVSQQLDILLGQDENLLLKPDTTILYQAVALQPTDYLIRHILA